MGLGGLRSISLKDTREFAAEFRALVARGIDPISHRDKLRREAAHRRAIQRELFGRPYVLIPRDLTELIPDAYLTER